jgi:hypothetical protein
MCVTAAHCSSVRGYKRFNVRAQTVWFGCEERAAMHVLAPRDAWWCIAAAVVAVLCGSASHDGCRVLHT